MHMSFLVASSAHSLVACHLLRLKLSFPNYSPCVVTRRAARMNSTPGFLAPGKLNSTNPKSVSELGETSEKLNTRAGEMTQ